MTTRSDVTSALSALGAFGSSAGDSTAMATISDGRAALVSVRDAPTAATIARVGSAYALLSLPRGPDGVVAARALLESALLPMADDFAVAPKQRAAARAALVSAALALEQLAKGQAVRVPPVFFDIHSRVAARVTELRASGSAVTPDAFGDDVAEDVQTLNEMQSLVVRWGAEIDRVVGAAREGPGTVLPADEEQLFWISVDSAFESAQDALAEPATTVSLQLLARKRRLAAFMSDSGDALSLGRQRAQGILNLVQSLPVGPVRTADDIRSLTTAVRSLLAHVTSKLRLSSFPLNRALTLVSSLSQDVSVALCKLLLRRGGLLGQPYNVCCSTAEECEVLFRAWDRGFEACRLSAVERAEARGESIDARPKPAFTALQTRIRDVTTFRTEHEALVAVLRGLLSGDSAHFSVDGKMARNLCSAYDAVTESCSGSAATDVSSEGEVMWNDACGLYASAVQPIELELSSIWDAQIGAAGTLAAKAAVGAVFATVVDRAAFASAVRARMPSLTEMARLVIANIRKKAASLTQSGAKPETTFALADLAMSRGLTPIAVYVLSVRQLSSAVQLVLGNVQQVVGPVRMEADLDLRDLAVECKALRELLNPYKYVNEWRDSLSLLALETSGSIFSVKKAKSLRLSLDAGIMTVPSEVAALKDLGFLDLARSVFDFSERVATIRPLYAMLSEGLHSYKVGTRAISRLRSEFPESFARLHCLLHKQKMRARRVIEEGAGLLWTSELSTLTSLGARLRGECQALCECVLVAVERDRQVHSSLDVLEELTPRISLDGNVDNSDLETIRKHLHRISMAVKEMRANNSLRNVSARYSRQHISPRVTRAMKSMLFRSVQDWSVRLVDRRLHVPEIALSLSSESHSICSAPALIIVENQLYASLTVGIAVICRQFAFRKDCIAGSFSFTTSAFGFAPCQVNDMRLKVVVRDAVAKIHAASMRTEAVLDEWRRFEGLWSIRELPSSTGDEEDVAVFTSVLEEVGKTRLELEGRRSNAIHSSNLGFAINCSDALNSVLSVIASFVDSLTLRCATVVANETKAVYSLASEAVGIIRESAVGDPMDALLVLQAVGNTVLPVCESKVQHLARLEELALKLPAFRPADDAVDMDAVAAIVSSLRREYDQRQRHIDGDRPSLEARHGTEVSSLELQLAQLFGDVSNHKDETAESNDASAVLDELAKMDARLEELTEKSTRLRSVSLALSLPECSNDMELETLAAELKDMRLSISEVASVQTEYSVLGKTRLGDLDSKSCRERLTKLGDRLREVQEARGGLSLAHTLDGYLKHSLRVHGLVSSLRSAKLSSPRERELMEKLFRSNSLDSGLYNVSLHDVWSCDLIKHEKYLRSVFESAASESALAAFLAAVADTWTSRRVEFVQRGRIHLIRGIPVLVDDANEHVQALCAMSGSSHARLFESERASWELRIAKFRDEVEVWAEVQTKWLHLSALFGEASPSSGALRRQLRDEFASFMSVQARLAEFSLRAKSAPGVLEVLEKPSGLERMSVELTAIVRGLGKFLESQRSLFPRFFYLSDDDLLSVLSISRENVCDIMPHLNKLFPGVFRLVFSGNSKLATTTVSQVVSKEGEVLPLLVPVVITNKAHIVSWLTDLEGQIEVTLRSGIVPLIPRVSIVVYGPKTAARAPGPELRTLLRDSPAQLVLLAFKVAFTEGVETALNHPGDIPSELKAMGDVIDASLCVATGMQLEENSLDKTGMSRLLNVQEQVIKELVYQRGVLRQLISAGGTAGNDVMYSWFSQLRFYTKNVDDLQKMSIEVQMADAVVLCGWEYLGVGETLVQTPLTCRCFLTLMQALKRGLGGSPFGPAGTGKTESVKALGRLLGRSVAVFNCDEGFDAVSVGRILAGVCRTGSWVCFDEFNRLSAGILSSTSNQLAGLQAAIQAGTPCVPNFYGGVDKIRIENGVAVFVTMNPSYTGRRHLPGNLTSLFRPMAMTQPDSIVIAEVSLLAQGFSSASLLSAKFVECFRRLDESLPRRSHYDFGLRSLKSAVRAAGHLLRMCSEETTDHALARLEEVYVVQAMMEMVKPKISPEDVEKFEELMRVTFPDANLVFAGIPAEVRDALRVEADKSNIVLDAALLEKIGQLFKILEYRPGVILVGPTGSCKTTVWRLLFKAMYRASSCGENAKSGTKPPALCSETMLKSSSLRVIDAKLMTPAQLYGSLDVTTREWTDGIFTSALRHLSALSKDHDVKEGGPSTSGPYHWLVFDGDIDPDWAENLNSVLDDSRVLTLPTGERIPFPDTARIVFETENVDYANPSTISRCGMVCFASRTSLDAVSERLLQKLARVDTFFESCVTSIRKFVPLVTSFVENCSVLGSSVMDTSRLGILHAQFALFEGALLRRSHVWKDEIADAEDADTASRADDNRRPGTCTVNFEFAVRSFLVAAASSLGASLPREEREVLSQRLLVEARDLQGAGNVLDLLPTGCHLCDVYVDAASAKFISFANEVQSQSSNELNPLRVGDPDVVVPTAATLSNSLTLADLIRAGCDSMVLLCGPPGCGKTMVIGDALSSMANVELAPMSFSATTAPGDILATLRAHASVQKLPNGDLCLRPKSPGSRLVLFCDEVNLGAPDKYGTQTAAFFLRQLLEHGGYWCCSQSTWVRVENLQIVAACNPPELSGRQRLPSRLLRHTHIMRIEAPAGRDLITIFGTLNVALLRAVDSRFECRADAMTAAMIEIFEANHDRFSPRNTGPLQPHYVYSPRDMSRWLRGMRHILLERGVIAGVNTADGGSSEESSEFRGKMFSPRHRFGETESSPLKELSWSDVVSALVHEARRLFVDRLMRKEERELSEAALRAALAKHLGFQKSSVPDQWYSAWSKHNHRRQGNSSIDAVGTYQPVGDVNSLRRLVYRKLRSFCMEEGLGGAWMSGSGAGESGSSMIDQFAVTDDVLKHLTRIERVLRLPLGHAVLIGAPGAGKKTLARFAAWMGGMSVHQARSHAGYTAEHFANDLRGVLNIAGVLGKPVMMIFDESNALDGEFLEMMNAILACGEVPGLFEGDVRLSLLSSLRKQNLGMAGSSTDEALYKLFVKRVRANLHVVFTLSCDAKALSSGSEGNAIPLGSELLSRSPALYNRCVVDWMGDWDSNTLETVADLKLEVLRGTEREYIVKASVLVHRAASDALANCSGAARFTTPRHFLEFVEQLNRITLEKAEEIQGGASRLQCGLNRLRETGNIVDQLKESLRLMTAELTAKESEANEALSAMAEEQRLAEKAKVDSETLAAQADEAAAAANERKAEVAEQLAAVEPKVEAARSAVGSIRKENLEELRAMPNPPAGVRLALQAVMMLLDAAASGGRSGPPMTWQEIRKRMRGPELIPAVVHFDPDSIPSTVVDRLQRDILSNPDFVAEKVSYSSRAAGPLAEWTMASLEYATVNESIAPLRAEAEDLENEHESCLARKEEAERAVKALRVRIDECRLQYAGLVNEAGIVRRDIEVAGEKLRSAEQMMESLEDEWDRWMAELTVYNDTAEFVWGNAVLGAAFVTYAGALDVIARRSLLDKWRLILNQGNIAVEENLSMAEYLTSLKERSAWSQKGLPMDETSVQSYAILKRSARYPLIIDPSRKMESVIRAVVLAARPPLSQEKQSHSTLNDGHVLDKVVLSKTSFASSGKQSYLRVIESAMRFGTAVLVEDAEQFDHSIAPVLGQEATTGDIGDAASQESGASGSCRDATLSHRLVRLGDRDVDQNPSFRLFLSATDLVATPSAAVSRCCVVSFTFSEANLLARCVSRALHFITPDLEAKRSELAAAKLAYEKRKAVLEEGLLAAIAEASDDSSSLLEGSLLTTLQTLKVETKDNEAQMSLRKVVADEVDFATLKYEPIAGFAVRIFFALSRLPQLNPLYRFSADYFLELLDTCIESACAQYGGKEEAILSRVFDDLAATVFTHVSPSLFPEDQAPFAAVLCIVAATDEVEQKEIDVMLKAFVQTRSSTSASKVADGGFTGPSSALLVLVSKMLDASVSNPAAIRAALNNLASRLQHNGEPAIYSPVSKSDNILRNEIQDFAAMQSSSSPTKIFFRPLLLCTRGAGVDPSSLVSLYCRTAGVACESLAVGDGESVPLTRLALDFASQKWHRSSDRRGLLLVKNLHLAPVECAELLRREIVKHQGWLPYLVIIAGEVGRCSPDTVTSNLASLSADCRVLAFEAPCDFRSTLTRSLSIARPSGEVVDFETSGLLTAVGWLHAAIIERCRYAPTGISKRYEFSEADLVAARDAVLSLFGQGRSKPYPDVLARLVADSIYGGRVESTLDNKVLEEMIKDLFASVVAHRSNQCIRVVHGASEGRHVDLPADAVEVAKAVGALPVAAPATWFGLDSTAEAEKEGRVGTASLDTVLKMYMLATCR